ncbi:endolytic transglycosylase MltG [Thalassotalea fusca]
MQTNSKQIKLVFLSCLLLIVSMAGILLFLTHQVVREPVLVSQPKLFKISKGSSFNQISKQLVEQNIISERFWLRNYVRLYPTLAQIKAGTYQILPNHNVGEVLNMMNKGDEHQFYITFVEGTRLSDWLKIIAEHPNIQQKVESHHYADIARAIGIENLHPEGMFFPDTYAFTDNTTDIAILKRAYQRMNQELTKVWQQRELGLPLNSDYEALILASIIEKESADKSEYRRISSVFINRLNKKMRLQTDPTVIYGVRDEYQGDIKRSHLNDVNAYNTYKIKGLPPTPIAMPGLEALKAAVDPEISDFLYFVSDGNGRHVFSTNLQAHNEALQRYLQKTK